MRQPAQRHLGGSFICSDLFVTLSHPSNMEEDFRARHSLFSLPLLRISSHLDPLMLDAS